METTTIRVSLETKRKLDKHGHYRDNYDSIILRLLEYRDAGQLKNVKPLPVKKESGAKKEKPKVQVTRKPGRPSGKKAVKAGSLGSFDNGV